MPVLDVVGCYFDEHPQGVILTCHQVADLTGRDPADVYRALKVLQPTYIRLVEGLGHGPIASSVRGVTDDARRVVGQWPSAGMWVNRLVGALREAAERESDPERKSRLRAMAEGLGGFARDLAPTHVDRGPRQFGVREVEQRGGSVGASQARAAWRAGPGPGTDIAVHGGACPRGLVATRRSFCW